MITGLYAGLSALLLLVLFLRVVRKRWAYKVGIGDGGIKDLEQAIRVHGNFVETVPIILILMVMMELSGQSSTFLHIYGVALIAARIAHAVGLTKTENTSLGRFVGNITTITLMAIGGLSLIFMNIG